MTTDVSKVWTIEIKPITILSVSTVVTMIGFIIYLLFSIMVFEDANKPLPSLSGMIAYSQGTTISYTLLVFVHSYGTMAYLVIVSEYIGVESLQFRAIALCSFIYTMSLIMVSYLPLNGNENPHNVFALISFTFALLTVYLHKHTFIITVPGKMPYIDFHVSERYLILSEILMIVTVSIMGMLFWSFDIMVAEYIFIGLMLMDKFFKVTILEKSGLLNVKGAKLEYTYFSPSNHAETCTMISKNRPVNF